jgi:hypothetical protein
MRASPTDWGTAIRSASGARLKVRWWRGDAAGGAPGGELMALLEEALPVHFMPHGPSARDGSGAPADDGSPELRLRAAVAGASDAAVELTLPAHAAAAPLVPQEVRFADDPCVPWPFRGRALHTRVPAGAALEAPRAGERVLAWSGRVPLLSVESRPGVEAYRSALALPDVAEDGAIHEVFNGTRFLELLPLWHLLQRAQGADAWRPAPLRAAFIVDDPNLHWSRYGCVDYRRFAAHAQRHDYHVAFATIPLDAWFTHAATAGLFRRHPERLSLVVHGNDHTSDELARPRARAARRALLQQALRRIGRLEARAGLQVGRVMVAPHGACSSDMLAELPSCGFEAACISTGSLRAHNGGEAWTRSAGLLPSEHVRGCAVLPRWSLSSGVPNSLLLAAYLGQALILCGHHRDCRDDLELFAEAARCINGLGEVRWADLPTLSRLNYQWRREGSTLAVRPFGSEVSLELPPGVSEVVVDAHPRVGCDAWDLRDRSPRVDDAGGAAHAGFPGSLPARRVSVAKRLEAPLRAEPVDLPAVRARFLLRRLLTETRDRLAVF